MAWLHVCYKRFAAVLLAVVTMIPIITAQTHYRPRISIGGRAGVTMSKIDITPSVPQGWLMGSTGAVTFRYTEEKLFGLVAELGWVQRGWQEDFEESPLTYSRQFTYLNLPVMTQIIFGGRRVKCFINLGPEVSYMIGESTKSNFDYARPTASPDWPDRPRQTEQMVMSVKNKFDYGITGSVGGEFYIKPRHSITLEVRYYFGLGNVFPASKADTFSASRCTSLEATVGYYFRLR